LNENQLILRHIENQIRRKLKMKRGYRKRAKVILEKTLRWFSRKTVFPSDMKVQQYVGDSLFGCDELGRDVEDGLQKYVSLLRTRGVRMHTVIVLGSRAKETWKPESDIDVTIVADDLPKEGRNFLTRRLLDLRRRIILSDRPIRMGIEPSGCCSREEFLKRMEQFDVQALDAVLYGQVIYDDGFWQTAKVNFKELAKKHGLEELALRRLLASA